MGVEESNDKPIDLIEVQPEVAEEEPIEQVFSEEPEDVRTVEPSTESEDREMFEETARFEEEIDTPNVKEGKPLRQNARKSKVTGKSPARFESEDKSVSQFHSELRKHSDARKKAEKEILDIRKELKDLLLVHHATIKDLQKQVAQMHKKIATIDNSRKSTGSKTTGKKTASSKKIARNNKTSSNKKSKKKSGQNKSRKR
jgi:hypothetical protein